MFQVDLEIDEDTNKIVSMKEIPCIDYIVDKERMKDLLENGYLGHTVLRAPDYYLRINMDENK